MLAWGREWGRLAKVSGQDFFKCWESKTWGLVQALQLSSVPPISFVAQASPPNLNLLLQSPEFPDCRHVPLHPARLFSLVVLAVGGETG